MILLVDVTRAFQGTESDVLSGILQQAGATPEDQAVCIKRTDQTISPPDGVGPKLVTVEESTDEAVLAVLSDELKNVGEQGEARVASFRPKIRQFIRGIEAVRAGVKFVPFASDANTAASPNNLAHWDESYIPVDEAMKALAQAISKNPDGETGIRKTSLRDKLAEIDSRFAKHAGTPSSKPGFITVLTNLATKNGIVSAVPTKINDQNPNIVLTEEGLELAAAAASVTVPVVDRAQSATRSDLFISTLRRLDSGPFQDVRLDVYEGIDVALSQGNFDLVSCIRNAVDSVRAADAVARKKPYPWSRVNNLLVKLFSVCPVVVYGDNPEGGGAIFRWYDSEAKISGLVTEWMYIVDGELITTLLREGLSLTIDDLPDLAGALYNSRQSDATDRVLAVVRSLIARGVLKVPDVKLALELV